MCLWGCPMARLLAVDDDDLVLNAIRATFAGKHHVNCVSTGIGALEIIEKGSPIELLLTDIKLPGLHGFALARIARRRLPDLKVVYISGYLAELEEYVGARFGPVVEKPIRVADLVRIVDDALSALSAQYC